MVLAAVMASPGGAAGATAGTAVEPLPIPRPPRYDDLVCYRIKDPLRLEARMRFLPRQSPPFALPPGCKARLTAREFCIPAAAKFGQTSPALSATGSSPIPPPADLRGDFLCYAIRCPREDAPRVLGIEDQFGRRKVKGFVPARICVPARKVLHPRCCDPRLEPGTNGTPACIEGASCCADGTWACNDGEGRSTCAVPGRVCTRCCDPERKPGANGTPACVEGASCCADGTWACNDATGASTCGADGVVCTGRCCDGSLEPGTNGTPACIEGAACCADGTWACNGPDGAPACDALGAICPKRRCGGIAGLACGPGEFCRLETGQCCCDFEGVCETPPEACPEIFAPVCGCDGETYSNECFARAAGVNLEHEGPCAGSVE